MDNKITAIIIVVVLVVSSFLLFKNRGVAPTEIEINDNMPVPGSDVEETQVVEEGVNESLTNIKEFSVDEIPFSLSLSTIAVNLGDTVRITVKNKKGTHDLKIAEFNASTRTLNVGEEEVITFVADKLGTFEYYCSVGNHRALGMVGTLFVR
ncbi:MAG: plastocyanin/azurin family copper-binding protein [Patescibacteria group bacterium]|nr:plastocyanin/azurin family copper-binding protein [Patescibacteria group bacterium]